jgi:hypothetical protein
MEIYKHHTKTVTPYLAGRWITEECAVKVCKRGGGDFLSHFVRSPGEAAANTCYLLLKVQAFSSCLRWQRHENK